ncbi:hypothetical protein MauCBS54593_000776 [Microsporum audouinii]
MLYFFKSSLRALCPCLYSSLRYPTRSQYTILFGAARVLRYPGHHNDSYRLSSYIARYKDILSKSSTEYGESDVSSPKLTILSEHQLDELLRGTFPSDYPFEVIPLNSSTPEAFRIYKAFENHKRVRVTTDRAFSTAIIRNSPTPLHQWMLASVSHSLQSQIPGYIHILLDSLLNTLTYMVQSEIIPDLQVLHQKQGITENFPILVAEVGFTQQYESLKYATCRAIDETQSVNVSLMINLKETPAFRTPLLRPSSGIHQHSVTKENVDKNAILAWLQSPEGENPHPENPSDPESPLFFLGARWVGRIEGTLEVWIRNPETGKAARKLKPVLFYGSKAILDKDTPRIDARSENVDVGLNLSDIIPSADDGLEKPFHIDWADWRESINRARTSLVRSRYLKVLKSIQKSGKKQKKLREVE